MDSLDHTTYEEWLDLEVAGELGGAERARLETHLAECPRCRHERRVLGRLDFLLSEGRLPVREGFRDQVMASLPPAGWEGRSARAWRLPAAVLALLLVVAAVLVALSPTAGAPHAPFLSAVGAAMDLVASAAVAGAGLLGASWKGVGLVMGAALSGSRGALAALALLVLCLDLLLVTLVRRRRPQRAALGGARSPGRPDGPGR